MREASAYQQKAKREHVDRSPAGEGEALGQHVFLIIGGAPDSGLRLCGEAWPPAACDDVDVVPGGCDR